MKENKSVVKKDVGAISKVGDKKKAIWLGSQTLMGKVIVGSKEAKEREIINMTARVLDVSPFGVNILGNLPYINNLGLSQKSEQYGKGKDEYHYNWIQRAINDTDKAICECKIIRDGKDITDWVLGECSPKTMKMGTLNGYQNHMAQTRAKNRAIKEAYGVKIHEEMMENISLLYTNKNITETQANALTETVGRSTQTSVEEVSEDKKTPSPINNSLFVKEEHVAGPDGEPVLVCQKCDSIIDEQVANYSKRVYGKKYCRDCQKLIKKK